MRAVAITYVMLSHGYAYSGRIVSFSYYRWLVLDGVGLFFVLSGFLIGGILIRKIESGYFGAPQLLDFWKRRWLRTLPAYFCVLTFLTGCYYLRHGQLPPLWARYYAFTQNFASPHPLFFGEAWSLSVEEWFYLLVPAGLFFLLRLPLQKRWLIFSWIFFVLALITSIRLSKVTTHDYYSDGNFGEQIAKVVITRMDAIMYGVLAAWLSIYFTAQFYRHKKILLIAGLVLLVCCRILLSDFFLTRLEFTFVPVATVLLLPFLSSFRNGSGPLYKCVTFISLVSYSMYLTNHMIVQRSVLPVVSQWLHLDPKKSVIDSGILWVLFWLLTIAFAYALYRLVEKPFMKLRDRTGQ